MVFTPTKHPRKRSHRISHGFSTGTGVNEMTYHGVSNPPPQNPCFCFRFRMTYTSFQPSQFLIRNSCFSNQ